MRVIAGALKGRRLDTPTWSGLRPTSDKLRETLFNVLTPRVDGARVLDAFAGTGALGIEALSRGAAHVTFVETDPRAQRLIAANLALCGVQEGYAIIRGTIAKGVERLLAGRDFVPFDLVLLDPPYDLPAAGPLAAAHRVMAPQGLVVLEHARRRPAPDATARLIRTREIVSGDSALSFYQCRP